MSMIEQLARIVDDAEARAAAVGALAELDVLGSELLGKRSALGELKKGLRDLDEEVLRRVEEIVDQGLGLDRWREGGPRMLSKREKVVREFLDQIRKPNPKPIKWKVDKRHPPIYLPGDCLAVELGDGSFAAVLVMACDDRHVTEGFDIVALLEWHSTEMPGLKVFEKGRLIRPKEDDRLIPVIRKCYARSHKKMQNKLHQIGQISRRSYNAINKPTRFMGRWEEVRSDLEHYYGLRS